MMKNYGYVISILGIITSMLVLTAEAGSQLETSRPTPLIEQEETCPYTIQPGDTLSHIASQLTGKTGYYPEIMRSNDLASEAIYPGDILQIPRRLLLPRYQCAFDTQQSTADSTDTPVSANSEVLAEIEVIVFEDKNNNQLHDPEEPGVPGIQVILVREGNSRTSDDQGIVLFTEVEPGDHAVGIDESTIPEGYRLSTKSTVLLSVTEGDKGYVVFGIHVSASKGTSE